MTVKRLRDGKLLPLSDLTKFVGQNSANSDTVTPVQRMVDNLDEDHIRFVRQYFFATCIAPENEIGNRVKRIELDRPMRDCDIKRVKSTKSQIRVEEGRLN